MMTEWALASYNLRTWEIFSFVTILLGGETLIWWDLPLVPSPLLFLLGEGPGNFYCFLNLISVSVFTGVWPL